MNMIEHKAGAERVRPLDFLEVGIDRVRSDRTEGNRKLAGSAKARIQADLGHDRNAVSHRFERCSVRGV